MNTFTLDRLIGYGSLVTVSCRWCEHDAEDQRRAYAEGEWTVWGVDADVHEYWLASGCDEAAARKLTVEAGLFLGVPMRALP